MLDASLSNSVRSFVNQLKDATALECCHPRAALGQ